LNRCKGGGAGRTATERVERTTKNSKDSEHLPQRREGAKEISFSNLAPWREEYPRVFKILKICASRENFQD